MPVARIRTNFPEEVSELCEALIEAGYVVETVRPDEFRISPADLELTVDKLPVVEAWRHLPKAETIYVAPDTPVSHDIRNALSKAALESTVTRVISITSARYTELRQWTTRQARELRARASDLRQRWTPPREYHEPVHLEPTVPSSLDGKKSRDRRTEKTRLELVQRNDVLRRKEEAERQRLAERARQMEENRRRAREAAEAKSLLEEQQKIEAMVQATEQIRERVLHGEPPTPRPPARRRPRRLLRTRRERAFVRAGVTAFALSMGLAVLAGEALHPQPASHAIPKAVQASSAVPFVKPVAPQNSSTQLPIPVQKTPAVSTFANAATVADAKSRRHDRFEEVIVRKAAAPPRRITKPTSTVAHYSDLD